MKIGPKCPDITACGKIQREWKDFERQKYNEDASFHVFVATDSHGEINR